MFRSTRSLSVWGVGGWNQQRRDDLEKAGVLAGGRMLPMGTNKTAAPIQIGSRAPVYHPVLSKQVNIPPPILSPYHLLLWGPNSHFLIPVAETVSPQLCEAKQAAAAISLAPSNRWTPGLHLHTLFKFKHIFSDCCSFFWFLFQQTSNFCCFSVLPTWLPFASYSHKSC